jgi:16S rRNA (guanine966-N2)-methyltransferase
VLRFVPRPGLRPTPDRVRETLFNWLGQDLSGLVCLDLFAGSGALGFEAVSRNAREVVMVEHDRLACHALRDNARLLGCESAVTISQVDAREFVRSTARAFDVVFLDPPFASDLVGQVAADLARIMRKGGMIYVESANGVTLDDFARLHRQRVAGQVTYQLFIHGHQ